MKRARWIFPLYLLLTSLAILPLVAAGALFAPSVNPDLLVLALPFQRGETLLTAVVFVGGFSAATAMVIVEAVALSAMVSNSLILPFLARERWRVRGDASDMAGTILQVRRGPLSRSCCWPGSTIRRRISRAAWRPWGWCPSRRWPN